MAGISRLRIPLRLMLMAGFILTCGVPMLGFWYWSSTAALEKEFEEVEERHLLIAQNLGAALERYYDDLTVVFDAFAISLTQADRSGYARPVFEKLRFRHVCVFDEVSGTLKFAYLDDVDPCPARLMPERAEMFAELLADSDGATILSAATLTPDGETVLFLVRRIGTMIVAGAVWSTIAACPLSPKLIRLPSSRKYVVRTAPATVIVPI